MMNEGTLDRTLRIIVGIVLVSLVFVGPQSMWGLLGLVPLATGVLGFCPVYRLTGLDTRPASQRGARARPA